jgi:hypothetical protein
MPDNQFGDLVSLVVLSGRYRSLGGYAALEFCAPRSSSFPDEASFDMFELRSRR